jgi:hypothetical protein
VEGQVGCGSCRVAVVVVVVVAIMVAVVVVMLGTGYVEGSTHADAAGGAEVGKCRVAANGARQLWPPLAPRWLCTQVPVAASGLSSCWAVECAECVAYQVMHAVQL